MYSKLALSFSHSFFLNNISQICSGSHANCGVRVCLNILKRLETNLTAEIFDDMSLIRRIVNGGIFFPLFSRTLASNHELIGSERLRLVPLCTYIRLSLNGTQLLSHLQDCEMSFLNLSRYLLRGEITRSSKLEN